MDCKPGPISEEDCGPEDRNPALVAGIAGRLLKGSIWLGLSRAVVNCLAIVSSFVLAWYLSPSDFGVVALGMTFVMIAASLAEFSLAEALIRHESPGRPHFNSAWTLNVLRGLLLCLLMASLAYPVATQFGDPRLQPVMLALGASLLIGGLTNPRRVMLRRNLIFWQEFVLSVSTKFSGVAASLTIAILYHSYWALLVGTLVTQVTSVILSYFFLPFLPRPSLRHAREFFSFSAWLAAGQLVNTLNWRFDYLLIGKVLGGANLGYYSFGSNIALLPTREATAPLAQTLFPGFSTLRHDKPRLAAAYQRVQSLVAAVALPAGAGMALVADPLVRLVLGEKWVPIIFVVQSLAAVYAIQTLGSLVQPLGMASGRTRQLFIRDTQMLLIRIPVIAVGLMLGGLHGVVLGRVLTGLIATAINMHLVSQFVGVSVLQQLSANARALFSIAVMAVSVAAASSVITHTDDRFLLALQLAALVALGALLYCGTSLSLWRWQGSPPGPEREILALVSTVGPIIRRK